MTLPPGTLQNAYKSLWESYRILLETLQDPPETLLESFKKHIEIVQKRFRNIAVHSRIPSATLLDLCDSYGNSLGFLQKSVGAF